MPAKPLNVLWLIDHVCFDGSLHGGGRLFMNLAPCFDPAKVRIFPYFLRASAEIERIFEKAPIKVKTLGLAKYSPLGALVVRRLCREHDIDVMHLFCYASSTYGRIIGGLTGIPTIIQDNETQTYFPYPLYLKIFDRILARSTGRALAASPLCRDYMRDVRRIPGDRIEMMFHAIPARHLELAKSLSRSEARRRLGWADATFMFCAVTKLGPERGNETLVKAFAEVRKATPDARLVIVYKPTLYHKIPREYEGIDWIRDADAMREHSQSLIDEVECTDAIELVESLDSPELYYAASDVLVAPFENDRFSSVQLVEAMAYGRPHIVTALGEAVEIAQTWKAGLVVPPRDVTALAAAMQKLASDPGRLAELSQRARAASGSFTTPATAERLSHVYAALAQGLAVKPVGLDDATVG